MRGPLRLELQSDQQIINDPFLACFQQALTERAGEYPTIKRCPTLRVKIRRPSEHELSRCFLFPNLKYSDCAVFSFELFHATGDKHNLSYLPDGTLRVHHYAFEKIPDLQLCLDGGLPGIEGHSSDPEDYARIATDYIFKQLAH